LKSQGGTLGQIAGDLGTWPDLERAEFVIDVLPVFGVGGEVLAINTLDIVLRHNLLEHYIQELSDRGGLSRISQFRSCHGDLAGIVHTQSILQSLNGDVESVTLFEKIC
jgi:hypothetical protein